MALSDFLVSLLTVVGVYTLFGLGLNVKYGFTGLVDFGHVLYFMIGAYVTVVVAMPSGAADYAGIGGFALPELLSALPLGGFIGWLLAVAVAMTAAALLSLLVGVPTLRLREDYLAITALGVATILHSVVNDEEWLFNGPFGVREVYQPLGGAFPLSLGSFTVNLVVFGLPSVLALGYVAYRVVRYVRPVSRDAALFTVAGVVLTVVGFGVTTLGGGAVVAAGAAVIAAGVYAVSRGVRVAGGFGRPLALFAALVFALWYLVMPAVTDSPAAVVVNLVWLFDPTTGANGAVTYSRFILLLTGAFVALAYLWCERTVNSPYGRVLRSIREDEDVPEALGKPTFKYKVHSMMFGSALAAAAGGLWATHIGFIDPGQFTSSITFFAFTAVIIGGTANNKGVILGTAVFWTLRTGTRFLDDYFPAEYATQLAALRVMLIGALLIVILYYRSEGLLGEQTYDTGVSPRGESSD
ncbi:branched-chain amino acid ABC transporter permease [Salarchaeum japonicum]|uniref:branched-chain amino acid ABC transporter permease n=1 Tax=Salarchaeum japonicum TaxID=555573 RepID=UPI003C70FFA1